MVQKIPNVQDVKGASGVSGASGSFAVSLPDSFGKATTGNGTVNSYLLGTRIDAGTSAGDHAAVRSNWVRPAINADHIVMLETFYSKPYVGNPTDLIHVGFSQSKDLGANRHAVLNLKAGEFQIDGSKITGTSLPGNEVQGYIAIIADYDVSKTRFIHRSLAGGINIDTTTSNVANVPNYARVGCSYSNGAGDVITIEWARLRLIPPKFGTVTGVV